MSSLGVRRCRPLQVSLLDITRLLRQRQGDSAAEKTIKDIAAFAASSMKVLGRCGTLTRCSSLAPRQIPYRNGRGAPQLGLLLVRLSFSTTHPRRPLITNIIAFCLCGNSSVILLERAVGVPVCLACSCLIYAVHVC